jgi:penicillin-binding protein 1C
LLVYGTPEPQVPAFAAVRAAYRPSDVPLLDRFGEVIHELRVDTLGRRLPWTPLAEVSPALQAAVMTSEDRRFYQHSGVDGMALTSAAFNWLRGKPLRGASTISMQVVTFLSPEIHSSRGQKALAQKWRQIRLAWALERHWSKSEILEAYLLKVYRMSDVLTLQAAIEPPAREAANEPPFALLDVPPASLDVRPSPKRAPV